MLVSVEGCKDRDGESQEALGSMKRESRSVVNLRGELGSVEED